MPEPTNNDERYCVHYPPAEGIKPSPENEQIYGPIDLYDNESSALEASIGERGLAEPIILTADNYIMSGHRRFAVCNELLRWETIPAASNKTSAAAKAARNT